MTITIEAPGTSVLNDLKPRFVVPVEQFVGDSASRVLVGQLQRLGAKPLNADHRDDLVRQYASDGCGGLEVVESHHIFRAKLLKSVIICSVKRSAQ